MALDDGVLLFDNHPFLKVKKSEKNSQNSFILVGAAVLDDQMLEDLSPPLVAPHAVKISLKEYKHKIKQEYDNAVCFKRCHIKNDFSASDYTAKQWWLLIGENGHTIFSEIPWETPDKKEKILSYLLNNAACSGSLKEGIGVWEKTDINSFKKFQY